MGYPNKELPHIWANQKAESGKGNNMFFEGSKIYSYGHHFCMAELIPDKRIVIYNSDGYSNSTAKHLCHVRGAIPSYYTVIESPGCVNDPQIIVPHYMDLITANIEKAASARKSETQEWSLNNANSLLIKLEEYLTAFKVGKSKFKGLAKLLSQKGNLLTPEIQERIKERKKEEQRKLKIVNAEKIEKWLSGQSDFLTNAISFIYLRVIQSDEGEKVETSKGAKVLLKSAKVLYKMIKAGKDIKGYQIDGYTVIGINGSLKIGCHEIDTKEVERFAKTQNW